MNITKELLDYLGIISLCIKLGEKDYICFLTKQINGNWIINTQSDLNVKEGETIKVQINYKDNLPAVTEALIILKDCEILTVSLPAVFNSSKIEKTFNDISLLEQKENKFGRRKEERIKIQKENSKDFMLKNIEQQLLLEKQILPCALVDVSLHGICLIAPYSVFYAKEFENFKVRLNFTDCTMPVIILCHKVHSRILKTSFDKTFISLSCQLLEPIHFEWKKHIISLLEERLK